MKKRLGVTSELGHLPKTNKVITSNSRRARGFGNPCNLCHKPIEEFPYFSHLSGGSHTVHYYHFKCAKKIHLL